MEFPHCCHAPSHGSTAALLRKARGFWATLPRSPAPEQSRKPESQGLRLCSVHIIYRCGIILKPDKKLEKLFIAQGASGFYETARRTARAASACETRGISNKAFYLKSVSEGREQEELRSLSCGSGNDFLHQGNRRKKDAGRKGFGSLPPIVGGGFCPVSRNAGPVGSGRFHRI